ncbi:MAG: hypothetical protein NZ750_03990 [Anaerolineae bacterium]|nr:hypothetical protein [Anaerolineae bacterium]MDW8171483.1 hypothetical protein [Anaerolineae bacterium]
MSGRDVVRYPVDAEHGGLRAVGCSVLVVALGVGYAILNSLIPDAPLLAFVVALLLAGLLSSLADRWLRPRWPSGRVLEVSDERLSLLNRDRPEVSLDAEGHINVALWDFIVARNGRVRKGWHVVSLGLEQDDELLVAYTFASPEDFDKLPFKSRVVRLLRPKEAEGGDMRSAGVQRRLLVAEQWRSERGAELTLEQFTALYALLAERFPRWMRS